MLRKVAFPLGTAVWVAIGEAYHDRQKRRVFDEARRKADELGLPLLNIGCKYWRYGIELSDINLDIVPRSGVPRFMLLEDARSLSDYFKPKSVVSVASHVLEHIPDWRKALAEIEKVSRVAYVITPNPVFLQTWTQPDHRQIWVGKAEVKDPWQVAMPLWFGAFLISLA